MSSGAPVEPGAPEAPPKPMPEASPGVDPCAALSPPRVRVVFPGIESSTNAETINARGFAKADCGALIMAMSAVIDGTELPIPITPDIEVEWRLSLGLDLNTEQTVVIRAISSDSLEDEMSFRLNREALPSVDLDTARGIVMLPGSPTAFVVDQGGDAILSVDTGTGSRTIFSGPGVGAGPTLQQPEGGIALDEIRNQLVVTDRGASNIVGIDLETGDRTIISDNTYPGVPIDRPRGIAVDAPAAVAYYVDREFDAVVKVNLLTGERARFSDDDTPTASQPIDFRSPNDLAMDAANGRLFVVDGSELIEVSLGDGSRRAIAQSTTAVSFRLLRGLTVVGNTAWVIDMGRDMLISVDLRDGPTLGDRTIVSGGDIGDGPSLQTPADVAYDSQLDRLILADSAYRFPLAVSAFGSGERIAMTEDALPRVGSGTSFTDPRGLVIDPVTSLLYITDSDTGQVIALDRSTGERSSVSGFQFIEPTGLGFDPVNRVFLLPNRRQQNVLSMTLNGDLSVVSQGFFSPIGRVALEPGGASLLVVDRGRLSVNRIERATGARSTLDRGADLYAANSLVVDAARNRVIVAVGPEQFLEHGAVLAYDLESAQQTVLANRSGGLSSVGSGLDLIDPVGVVLDEANERVLTFDAELDAIISVELNTLVRTVVSDASTGNGDHLTQASNFENALVSDSADELVYAVNERVGEVVLVDLTTGDQVVIAR
ncbi:MAG: hypothetical protein AAF654_09315 [Myxococcota bacterium]